MDLSRLEKAIVSLEEALTAYDNAQAAPGSPQKTLMRDGTIQRFEYTFEMCWKMLKRYLEEYGLERVDTFTNRELFRVGAETGLLADAELWFDYLRRRNLTSHTYDDKTAQEVFQAAAAFSHDARFLLERLKERAV